MWDCGEWEWKRERERKQKSVNWSERKERTTWLGFNFKQYQQQTHTTQHILIQNIHTYTDILTTNCLFIICLERFHLFLLFGWIYTIFVFAAEVFIHMFGNINLRSVFVYVSWEKEIEKARKLKRERERARVFVYYCVTIWLKATTKKWLNIWFRIYFLHLHNPLVFICVRKKLMNNLTRLD